MRRKTQAEFNKEVNNKFNGKFVVLGEYTNQRCRIDLKCKKHNHTFSQTAGDVISGKHGCKFCISEVKGAPRLSLSEMKARLPNGFSYVSGYISIKSKCRIKCKKHDLIWEPVVDNVIRGHGCPQCKQDAVVANRYKRKTYILGKTEISVQGYEPYALDWLQTKYKSSDIVAGSGIKKGAFKWVDCEGTVRWTFPDIYIKSTQTLIEVKSTYTLGIDVKKGWLRTNKAKARSADKQGIKYSLLVVKPNGSVRKLPKLWYQWPRDKIYAYVQ